VVGESRENQKLTELEKRLMKNAPFDPQVDAFGAQARNHNMHQKVAENAQAGEAMQDVGVTLDAPTPAPQPSPDSEPIVVPLDFEHSNLQPGFSIADFPLTPLSLAISFTSMANCYYVNNFVVVKNLVDNSIIANPDTPEVLNAGQFFTSWGTGILGKRLDGRKYSVNESPVKIFQLFTC
jgi:hypothetical protein